MTASRRDAWYKLAVIYGVDVERFADGNGDGIGDFVGLGNRLDYLSALGVDCLWLLPFYPTAGHDNGYDITDFYGIDERLGSLGDFVTFIERAEQYGIRVIVDLVMNHTSREHPWFQQARADPHSPFRDYYVWSRERPPRDRIQVMFPGPQETNWTWDEQAQAYYMHTFYETQPDLNIESAHVRGEVLRVVGFWLRLGVAGFRVDAAPYLIQRLAASGAPGEEALWFLDDLHAFVSWRRSQAILLAEANVDPEDAPRYVGEGRRMDLMFNFLLNQQLMLALATERAGPLRDGLEQTGGLVDHAHWLQFLRNQDELDLGRLAPDEREAVIAAFAPEEEMQIYGRGIRRRLPPMLNGDRAHIELAYSLLFSLPGTPLLIYGDEIGMGDDLSLRERESVRTAMQWSADASGGFSPPGVEPRIPIVRGGPYGVERVNVAAQEAHPGSLLSWIQRLLRVRRRHVELGIGHFEVLDGGDERVFCSRMTSEDNILVAAHNLSAEPVRVTLPLLSGPLHAVFGNREYPDPSGDSFELDPYGYRWLSMLRTHASE